MHDAYAVGATLLVILLGLLYNGKPISDLRTELRADIHRLENRMDARFTAIDMRFDTLHRDLTQFSREQGKHDARLDALESKKAKFSPHPRRQFPPVHQ